MSTALKTVALIAAPQVILAYGELTDDMNPIHIDPVYAAGTSMGGCIAHGTMSIGLLWQCLFRSLGETASQRVDLDVRFIQPVRVGETIHAGGELREGETGCYTVWVRGDDGVDRVTGTARLLHEEALA